ncbi:MAG TPA: hypothetical protein VLM41_06565 [Steroidobacteraceae bacterium]|nr:hypothetical protein [Steroidobacteraceae bacterium]
MKLWTAVLLAGVLGGWGSSATAQDLNILLPVPALERQLGLEPFEIVSAEISRPKAKGDITLKADASFAGQPPYRIKLRKAEPGAEEFNNRPRYDLAAYELQKLFLDPEEYVVPPTSLRMLPLAEFQKYSPDVRPTFRGSDQVLAVLQYWLNEVKVIADVYDPSRFAADPVYARHIGQLNMLTFLIEHGDSNVGNFLISRAPQGARVFSIDNGVAFAHNESDRGDLWRALRVNRLPADAVQRLRTLSEQDLEAQLAVLAQWELRDGQYVAVPLGESLSKYRGVRLKDDVVQLGLTRGEILGVWRQCERLLKEIDDGKITTF